MKDLTGTEKLLEYAQAHSNEGAGKTVSQQEEWRLTSVEDSLQHSLIKGDTIASRRSGVWPV